MINLQILKITHNLIIKQKRDKQHHLLGISLTREWNLHNLSSRTYYTMYQCFSFNNFNEPKLPVYDSCDVINIR